MHREVGGSLGTRVPRVVVGKLFSTYIDRAGFQKRLLLPELDTE